MAYRRPTRTSRKSRSPSRKRAYTGARRSNSRVAKARKYTASRKRSSSTKRVAPKQQTLRIVLTHEGVNPVQRPSLGAVQIDRKRKAKF